MLQIMSVQRTLLTMAKGNMSIYTAAVAELNRFLVNDYEKTRIINDDGVFDLAHGLKSYSAKTVRIRGLLLALCKNNVDQCNLLFDEIFDEIVKKGKFNKSLVIKEESVLELANSLRPREPGIDYGNSQDNTMITNLNMLHESIKKSSSLPEIADSLFSKPGADFKHEKTQ